MDGFLTTQEDEGFFEMLINENLVFVLFERTVIYSTFFFYFYN
jgi:hypothetical protein